MYPSPPTLIEHCLELERLYLVAIKSRFTFDEHLHDNVQLLMHKYDLWPKTKIKPWMQLKSNGARMSLNDDRDILEVIDYTSLSIGIALKQDARVQHDHEYLHVKYNRFPVRAARTLQRHFLGDRSVSYLMEDDIMALIQRTEEPIPSCTTCDKPVYSRIAKKAMSWLAENYDDEGLRVALTGMLLKLQKLDGKEKKPEAEAEGDDYVIVATGN